MKGGWRKGKGWVGFLFFFLPHVTLTFSLLPLPFPLPSTFILFTRRCHLPSCHNRTLHSVLPVSFLLFLFLSLSPISSHPSLHPAPLYSLSSFHSLSPLCRLSSHDNCTLPLSHLTCILIFFLVSSFLPLSLLLLPLSLAHLCHLSSRHNRTLPFPRPTCFYSTRSPTCSPPLHPLH